MVASIFTFLNLSTLFRLEKEPNILKHKNKTFLYVDNKKNSEIYGKGFHARQK
jgi:hypothetical protein